MLKKHYITIGLVLAILTAGFLLYCPLAQTQRDNAKQHFGYTPAPEETAAFVASLPTPTISHADPKLFKADKTDTFLYRALAKAYKETYGVDWVPHNQGIGDCISHGFAHAADVSLAVDWSIGKSGSFKSAATESIYGGSRVEARGVTFGGWSDGSYGGAAAKWLKNWGVIYREKYADHDLTVYDSSRAKNWGAYGNGGKDDGGKLDTTAKQHPIHDVTLVRSFDEAAIAIQNGFPVAVCSGQGFNSTRDLEGFCRAQGSWSHCMCFTAVRYGARPGLLCQNSWSKYVSGPKFPPDQPDGSFWVDAAVATRMLSGGDSFAVSGAEGFKFRDLRHGDWAGLQPSKNLEIGEAHYALAP